MFATQLLVFAIIVINVNAGSVADTVQVRNNILFFCFFLLVSECVCVV